MPALLDDCCISPDVRGDDILRLVGTSHVHGFQLQHECIRSPCRKFILRRYGCRSFCIYYECGLKEESQQNMPPSLNLKSVPPPASDAVWACVADETLDDEASAACFSPSKLRLLAIVCEEGTLLIWKRVNRRGRGSLWKGKSSGNLPKQGCCGGARQGQSRAVTNQVPAFRLVQTCNTREHSLSMCSFSPNGKMLCLSGDTTVCLWHVRTCGCVEDECDMVSYCVVVPCHHILLGSQAQIDCSCYFNWYPAEGEWMQACDMTLMVFSASSAPASREGCITRNLSRPCCCYYKAGLPEPEDGPANLCFKMERYRKQQYSHEEKFAYFEELPEEPYTISNSGRLSTSVVGVYARHDHDGESIREALSVLSLGEKMKRRALSVVIWSLTTANGRKLPDLHSRKEEGRRWTPTQLLNHENASDISDRQFCPGNESILVTNTWKEGSNTRSVWVWRRTDRTGPNVGDIGNYVAMQKLDVDIKAPFVQFSGCSRNLYVIGNEDVASYRLTLKSEELHHPTEPDPTATPPEEGEEARSCARTLTRWCNILCAPSSLTTMLSRPFWPASKKSKGCCRKISTLKRKRSTGDR
mmetsp:Transcript_7752/g.20162  ORF Transcript_7752/g.20162 Transcript_7752/m.20162 type:complete len:584 (-) Transcript_7752:70-1821(-)